MFRSIGFTAYNTLYLADIAPDEMNNANTLASTAQQLTLGLGVAVGAIALYAATPINRAFDVASAGRGLFRSVLAHRGAAVSGRRGVGHPPAWCGVCTNRTGSEAFGSLSDIRSCSRQRKGYVMAVLGSSGIEVFPLALGGNTSGWTSSKQASFDVLDAYVEGGGTFVDTADVYSVWVAGNSGGESETIIGEWMAARRNRSSVVVGSKVSQHPEYRGLSGPNIVAAAHASLRRLQTDYIDLYYAHYDDPSTRLRRPSRPSMVSSRWCCAQCRYLQLLPRAGRGVGRCCRESRSWVADRPAAPLQPSCAQRVRKQSPIARVENQLAVVPYRGLAAGFLSGKYRSVADGAGVARTGDISDYLNDRGFAVAQEVERVANELAACRRA